MQCGSPNAVTCTSLCEDARTNSPLPSPTSPVACYDRTLPLADLLYPRPARLRRSCARARLASKTQSKRKCAGKGTPPAAARAFHSPLNVKSHIYTHNHIHQFISITFYNLIFFEFFQIFQKLLIELGTIIRFPNRAQPPLARDTAHARYYSRPSEIPQKSPERSTISQGWPTFGAIWCPRFTSRK